MSEFEGNLCEDVDPEAAPGGLPRARVLAHLEALDARASRARRRSQLPGRSASSSAAPRATRGGGKGGRRRGASTSASTSKAAAGRSSAELPMSDEHLAYEERRVAAGNHRSYLATVEEENAVNQARSRQSVSDYR